MNKVIISILIVILSIFLTGNKIVYDFEICGHSMLPVLNNEKYCTMYKVVTANKYTVNVNDIICYNYDKRCYEDTSSIYVCHRIIGTSESYVYTKGDNNTEYDCPNEWKNVAFKVIL